MAKLKFKTQAGTAADAVSVAYGELQALAEEAREIVDNASEGLSQTQRIQTFEQTADTLEGLEEPVLPDAVAALPCEWSEQLPKSARRGLSRASRCGNAVNALDAAISAVQGALDDGGVKGVSNEELEEIINNLEEHKGEAEGCEFPGMYG